ncbi:MAG: 3-methyl-2-oxobutanoate hydroxymethyltransferase [Eubacteriaceae bacterium]|nr:3-methyl-2-oxobutanoate hydroxymethyltransferase [Eubacteriaceae bacterium]
MSEEKKQIEISNEDKKVQASKMKKGRKTIAYLQEQKDKGEKLVQMCPANRDQYFTMAAEMAGCDICRLTVPAENTLMSIDHAPWWIRTVRNAAKIIHINFYMQTPTFCSKEKALEYGSMYMAEGADSLLPMGVSNETLKYMADNHLVVFGHVGALSGWQTSRHGGYKRLGKTAEDAMDVFRMAYEYQENGMMAMTIELTPIEITNAIAKKLRVPVISIAAGGAADGCEMVDFDTFNMMPSPVSHAKAYGDFFKWAATAYGGWANDVRTGAYPEDKHGFHMEEKELDKFMNILEQKYTIR